MKQLLLLILLLSTQFNHPYACLNGNTKVLTDGTVLYAGRPGGVPKGRQILYNDNELEALLREKDSLYNKTKNIGDYSDKGVLLILLKRYDEAIRLYQSIERLAPDRYSTASNMGTAYELLGQDENALRWIKRAVEIDSASHRYSEWIHVNILAAKINGAGSINARFLLNTDFGTTPIPETTLPPQKLQRLFDALYYQLNERVSFVRPKDPIVAQMYFDLGNIAFLSADYADALEDYAWAIKYGFSDQLIAQRIAEAKIQAQKAKAAGSGNKATVPQSDFPTFRLGMAAALLLTTLVLFIYRRKKTRRNDE